MRKKLGYNYNTYWESRQNKQAVHDGEEETIIKILSTLPSFNTVLEVGAGQGRITKLLKDRFSCKVTSLDMFCDNIYSDNHIMTDITNFTPSEIYDLVLSVNFLMHIKPSDFNNIVNTLNSCSKEFIAVEYSPKKPIILHPHNFIHMYNDFDEYYRINDNRVILRAK